MSRSLISFSTTVRNPERLRPFLTVLKKIEGQNFDIENQIKYQIMLIQERLYKPTIIPTEYKKYFQDLTLKIPFEAAEKIFHLQNYQDPPMRGRQSVNPLNKLGFAIARSGQGKIIITDLGNKYLEEDYDITEIFFKSLLKLQFPNPWSEGFSEEKGFDTIPFISSLHLIYKINKKSEKKGLSNEEFCLFLPTLVNINLIDEYVDKISAYRKAKNKKQFVIDFAKWFYDTDKLSEEMINNFYEYGDNIMRYFKLTKYFKIQVDPLGNHWRIDLEPTRISEVKLLLDKYSGASIKFKDLDNYLKYISNISEPKLPWEDLENKKYIYEELRNQVLEFVEENRITLEEKEFLILKEDVNQLKTEKEMANRTLFLRDLYQRLNTAIRHKKLTHNTKVLSEIIEILLDKKALRDMLPEQFEKLTSDALKIIDDEIQIKPNYVTDDEGEPISHASGNKPDIECYYEHFNAIFEVTLNTGNFQWVQEGQPIMRHLRDFENNNSQKNVFCIFVSPKIHQDTYSQFWFAVRYEYDGRPQKIVPLTTEQFAQILEQYLLKLKSSPKTISHNDFQEIFIKVLNNTTSLTGFSEWIEHISNNVKP